MSQNGGLLFFLIFTVFILSLQVVFTCVFKLSYEALRSPAPHPKTPSRADANG